MTQNIITLDFINDAAEKEYGSLTIESPNGPVKLRNPVRLSKDERKALRDVQEAGKEERKARKALIDEHKAALEAAGDDEDAVAAIPDLPEIDEDAQFRSVADLLELLADDRDRVRSLVSALNGDIALISTVMKLYNEAVAPGEA